MQLSKFRRSVAAVAAAAVAFGGLALALPANAVINPIIPDASATADLTIHKFEYDGVDGDRSDGLPKAPTDKDLTGLKPMGGIEFQVQKVPNYDLSTNAGWQALGVLLEAEAPEAAAALAIADAQEPDAPVSETTGATNGIAAFEKLPIGLYLVTELLNADQIKAGITAIDSPFLVTLPLTHPEDLNTWIYDVHVYPKNLVTEAPKKTVSDGDGNTLAVGDDIEWTITAPIPVGKLTAFGIRDVLSGHLSDTDKSVYLSHTATAVSVTDDNFELERDYHYVVTSADTENNNTAKVVFTDEGLKELEQIRDAGTNAEVKVVFTTEVLDLPANGVLVNQAASFPNDTYDIDKEEDPGVPSNEVKSKFGNLNITKQNQEEVPQLLSGAEFQVFATEADALAGKPAIEINEQSTWTTGDDGEGLVTIKGLRASNWANGALVAEEEAGYQTYWLLETKAPDGYELLAEPVEFTVTADANDSLSLGTSVITNVPANGGFDLPLTGGAGTALFTIVGLTLVAGAGVVLARSRKTATK